MSLEKQVTLEQRGGGLVVDSLRGMGRAATPVAAGMGKVKKSKHTRRPGGKAPEKAIYHSAQRNLYREIIVRTLPYLKGMLRGVKKN